MSDRIDLNDPDYVPDATQPTVQKKGNGLWRAIGGLIALFIIYEAFIGIFGLGGIFGGLFEPSYYVAKLPSYSAAAVKVDGYMHKDRSCCKKVADYFGAEVIRVKPSEKAGTNSYGQTVQYEDCFYYCPLCCK